ncbi:helix-turn-helix domain-containing protein [uncultured Sphingomonas sp.]|uniref:helix-turn-helix domain-containing protein n=1 Tax=uncultured Sphingomonas sp. TaxID=158754 RepID=UPI0025EDA81A|nr:helix-turn-helix domain-containing protein [uncultured Sphingomonas sp.]
MRERSPIPAFYLYGEPQRSVAEGFVHVESLDDRSRPSEWTIRPHLHRDLHHVILIAEGGGSMTAEGETVAFDAPALLLVPAGIAHGFTWHRESRGWVCTIADSYFAQLAARDAALETLFRTPRALALDRQGGDGVATLLADVQRELNWAAPGQRAAVEAALLAILVRSLRQARTAAPAGTGSRREAEIVARLRARIEDRFRLREPVGVHARALGVSNTALRLACSRIAGSSPAAMLDARALLEARRLLLYSQLSVGEIADAVGFEDPAYFSRFFARHVGMSPRGFRAGSNAPSPPAA